MLDKNRTLRLGAAVACAMSAASHAQALTVTASGTSYEMAGLVPNPVAPSTLTFTITGGAGPQYVSATSDSTDFPVSTHVLSNTVSSVTVGSTLTPTKGQSRSGQITVRVCADVQCAQVEWSQAYPYAYNQFQIDGTPLVLTGAEGAANTPVHVAVKPADSGSRLVVATSTSPAGGTWLSANHNVPGDIAVRVTGVGLQAGSYYGTTTVSLKLSPTTSLAIPVSFTVGEGIVAPALSDITLQRATTVADLQASATVGFRGAQSPAWTAQSDQPWLVLDTPSGVGEAPLKYHVDLAVATAAVLDWESAQATVTVHAKGLTDARSTMTFRRQLPEITMLTPSQVVLNQGATLALSGRGLSQVTQIGQITIGGQPATSGNILSDTQALVQLPPQPAGALLVGVANASGAPAFQAQVAIAKGNFANASVPAPGNDSKSSIVYDPSRKAVFAASYYGSTLQRFQFQGGAWVLKAVPWANAWRVQMSPDRGTLYVLDTAGVCEVDPDTLKLRVRHVPANQESFFRGAYFDDAMPLTNDLRLWMPAGTEFFDIRHGTYQQAAAGEFAVVDPDSLVGTPDGAHLFTLETRYSPPAPDGWYSTASRTTTPLAAGLLSFAYPASFDEKGALGVFQGRSVYRTSDWTLVGNLSAPANEFNYTEAAISPDGRRVYAIAAPASGDGDPTHINIYDTSKLQPGTANLVLLGSIPVSNPAAMCSGRYECDPAGRLVIDPIGSTLFWAGNQAFTVIAIPKTVGSQVVAGQGAVRVAAPR